MRRGIRTLAVSTSAAVLCLVLGFWTGRHVAPINVPNAGTHMAVRVAMVGLLLPQIAMQPGKFDVILGDSITEGAFLQTADSRPLLNAAIGGGGIDSMFQMLNQLETYRGRIDRALMAIGVNDAQRGAITGYPNGRSEYLDRWAQHYQDAAQILADLGAKVTLFPILPVEDSKPLGTGYFDPEAIHKMNEAIREIGSRHGWPVADVAVPTAANSKSGIIGIGSTVDGVHPTSATYRKFVDAVRSALE
jgi:hypothetical protein